MSREQVVDLHGNLFTYEIERERDRKWELMTKWWPMKVYLLIEDQAWGYDLYG